MPLAQFGSAMYNNTIYIVGGVNDQGDLQNTMCSFDIATGSWKSLSPLPELNVTLNSVAMMNGFLYSIGGFISGEI